jgi:hypothetical protein
MKGIMKKLFLGLSLIALLAGCASRENNGMGGTSDQYNQSSGTSSSSENSSENSNLDHGTGTQTAPYSTTGQSGASQ